jgi:hypothetical protein
VFYRTVEERVKQIFEILVQELLARIRLEIFDDLSIALNIFKYFTYRTRHVSCALGGEALGPRLPRVDVDDVQVSDEVAPNLVVFTTLQVLLAGRAR